MSTDYLAPEPIPAMESDGLGSRMWNGLVNLIGGGEPEDSVDAAAVQNRYNSQRDSVRARVGDLGHDGDYRPLEVLSGEDFFGNSAQLRARVDKIDLTAVRDLSDGWKKITERNTTSLTEFQGQIARGTAPEVWRGAAAQAAAQTVADYQATGGRVSNSAALTGNKIDELLTGLAPTKELVPHPPEHRSGLDNARSWVVGRGWRNDDVAEANAVAEAKRVLRTVYAQVVHESDANVPVIPLPKPIASGDGGTDGGTDGNGGITGGNGQQPTGVTPGGTQPATTTPDDGQDQDGGSPQSDSPAYDPTAQDTDGATTPQSTLGTNAAGVGTPGTGVPGGGGLGSGGLGSGGLGSGGGAAGGASPGAALPPASGAAAGANRAGAGTGAGSGAGRAGMGGMGAPGGARGKGEDEQSKAVPDYLINQENGNELTGLDDLPKTVPPVIGA